MAPTRDRWLRRLLIPAGLALAAFAGALAVLRATGTNRTAADFWLGVSGLGAGALSLLASGAAIARAARRLRRGPRRARAAGWIAVHLGASALVLAAASAWLGAHLV